MFGFFGGGSPTPFIFKIQLYSPDTFHVLSHLVVCIYLRLDQITQRVRTGLKLQFSVNSTICTKPLAETLKAGIQDYQTVCNGRKTIVSSCYKCIRGTGSLLQICP